MSSPFLRTSCAAIVLSLSCATALSACESDHPSKHPFASPGDKDPDTQEQGGDKSPVVHLQSAALLALRSCDDVDRAVRNAAKRAIRALIDEQRKESLKTLEGGRCWNYVGYQDAGAVDYAPEDESSGGSTPSGSGPSAVSETNNQVEGIDEADFVKNDDGYIYVLAGGALQIVDAWPAAESRVLSRTPLPHEPKRMFVTKDRALVFMSKPKSNQVAQPYDNWWYGRGECTYGYDCEFTGDGNATELALYDIADRSAPKLLRTIELSGSYLSARRVGTAVHMMIYDEPELLRTLPIVPLELAQGELCTGASEDNGRITRVAPGDIARAHRAYDDLEEANSKAIDEAPLAQLMGYVKDQLEGKETVDRDHCQGFYDSPLSDGTSLLSLLSLDMVDNRPLQASSLISRAGASYASGNAYYVAVSQQPRGGYWYEGVDEHEASIVHKFAIAANGNVYAASGVVKGRVLNQFSMDEYAGHLRIATTSGYLPSPDVHSTLSILQADGHKLVQRGQVDEIAKTEDIRSVRFLGKRGYVVTFKKTDPLFVFDLADPKAPKIVGELKIPGFSTYMHPLDDNHLLAIGFDAADQGDFAYFQGLQLQVFDVTDPAAPELAYKQTLGTRGSSSEAATNHLAFSYFTPKQTLAVPVTICEGTSGTGFDFGSMTFSGIKFYRVTATSDFSLTGGVSHPYVDPYDNGGTYGVGAACSRWWSDAQSVVKRTVFMDDFVYSISERRLKVNDLRDLSLDVADVALVE